MPAASFRCPGCGAILSSPQALKPGKLVDCPQCQLLFAPVDADALSPRARGASVSQEQRWASEVGSGPYPASSPWTKGRRRGPPLGPVFQAVLIVGGGLLLVGGAALGMYIALGGRAGPGPIASAPSPPPISLPSTIDPIREPDAEAIRDDPLSPRPGPGETRGEHTLVGDWVCAGDPVDWPGVGAVYAVTFRAGGAVVVRTRAGLEVETIDGTWKNLGRTGDRTRVRLSLGREIEAEVQFVDADRMTISVGNVTATFRRP